MKGSSRIFEDPRFLVIGDHHPLSYWRILSDLRRGTAQTIFHEDIFGFLRDISGAVQQVNTIISYTFFKPFKCFNYMKVPTLYRTMSIFFLNKIVQYDLRFRLYPLDGIF